jgi:hypothetical protein
MSFINFWVERPDALPSEPMAPDGDEVFALIERGDGPVFAAERPTEASLGSERDTPADVGETSTKTPTA